MAGCKNEDDITKREGSTDIAFHHINGDWQQGTRALANNATDLQAKPFVVLGKYSSGATYNAAAASTVFNNQGVSYDATDGWTYEPLQSWQRSSTYRFCAFWPKTDDVTLTGDLNSTLSIENFKVDADLSKQADLCISNVVQQKIDDNPRAMSETEGNKVHDGIALNFRHLLCNVRFSVAKTKGTEAAIKVTNVRIYNVKNTSTFTTTSTDNGSNWSTGTWTQPTGSIVYNSGTISRDVAVAETNATTHEYEWTTADGMIGNGFVVIPQTVNQTGVASADKVYVIVEYSSTPTNGTATVRRITADLPISDGGQVWPMNKRVTYKMLINEDNTIKFGKPTIEPWGTAQASGTIIIK